MKGQGAVVRSSSLNSVPGWIDATTIDLLGVRIGGRSENLRHVLARCRREVIGSDGRKDFMALITQGGEIP